MITKFFIQPFWLAAGLLTCCGVMLFLRLRTVRRRKELEKFASPHLLPLLTANVSQTRRRLKSILFILGLACLFMALARPLWGSRWVELRHRGIDILIGFDVSKSMLTPDIKPSRLQRAKLAVRDFAARLDGDRIGLLPFAGTSFLICPLTTDYDAFTASLDALDTATIPKGGTNIGGVIRDAVRVLKKENNHKILVLITDGEDLSRDALQAAALAKQEKMIIYAVGVGTAQGELIPLPDGGAGNFVKDPLGSFVTSRLDEKTLAAVAETTGGIYVPLGSMGQGLDTVYQRKLAVIPKEEHGRRKRKVPMERFQWLLGAAILLLSVDFLLIGRRQLLRLPQIFTAGRRKKRRQAAAVLLCCILCCAGQARADQGIDLFQAGKYKQAAEYYANKLKERNEPVLHFNRGTALLKQGKYKEAAAALSKALQSDDLDLQAKSYYNRGISQYYQGRTAAQTDLGQAIAALKQAEDSFQAAAQLLQTRKKAKAAHYQQEAEKERKRLEQQQQSSQQNNNKEQKKQQDSQDQQSKDGKEQKKNQQQSEENGNKEKKQRSGQNNTQENQDTQDQQKQQDAANGKKPGDQQQENKKNNKPPQSGKQDSEKKQEKDGKDGSEQKSPQAAQADAKQKQSENGQQSKGERMKTGKMTEEEAKSLLDSLKDEQGELNFIPQEAADGDEVGRDW
ncbi:VWFA domain-containing protein [Candidatus Electronema halotolerans]